MPWIWYLYSSSIRSLPARSKLQPDRGASSRSSKTTTAAATNERRMRRSGSRARTISAFLGHSCCQPAPPSLCRYSNTVSPSPFYRSDIPWERKTSHHLPWCQHYLLLCVDPQKREDAQTLVKRDSFLSYNEREPAGGARIGTACRSLESSRSL